MAFIIKAGTLQPGAQAPRRVAFNFEDVSQQASQCVDTARAQAAAIIAKAKKEAEQIRARAVQEGRAQAAQAARQEAQRELAEKWQALKPTIDKLIRGIEQAREDWIRNWEKQLAHLAVRIAEKIIQRQLAETPQLSHDWIRQALELASGSRQLKIYVGPEDYATLNEQRAAITDLIGATAAAEIIADPAIENGGCRVVTEFGEIDSRLQTQLARIEEELGG